MLTASETSTLVAEVVAVDKLIRRSLRVELNDVLDAFDLYQIGNNVDEFHRTLASTTQQHTEALQNVYSEFYGTLRTGAGLTSRYRTVRPSRDVIDVFQWGTSDLFGRLEDSDITKARRKILNAAETEVTAAGRNVVTDTAAQEVKTNKDLIDVVRYKRVAVGKTCSFCLMVASRGAVYVTDARAGEGRKWHHHCDCVVVPEFVEIDRFRDERLRRRYRVS